MASDNGQQMMDWAGDLWPICRSLTGSGLRETLRYLSNLIDDLEIVEVPSGTTAFDWTVPDEWNIRDAYVSDEQGNRLIDFQANNLHIVGYSIPVDEYMTVSQLDQHLYSLPGQPDAIPYVTSYYERRWGFCISEADRAALLQAPDRRVRVVIDSTLGPGDLSFGECLIPGESSKEIFLSTYVCHPSMANNELSGPLVTTALARWLHALPRRTYSYRIVFIPETIGSIVYCSRNLDVLKRNVIAGFNISCVGDDRSYSYLPSRRGDTLSDQVATHVLGHLWPDYKQYTWLDRGSDERQYCSPGIDLPIATIMRTKYGEYPEYHTSLDTLGDVVTAQGLEGGFQALRLAIQALEQNAVFETTILGEPQMGRRGLYPTLSQKGRVPDVETMMDLISLCDGKTSLLEIANRMSKPIWVLHETANVLLKHNILRRIA